MCDYNIALFVNCFRIPGNISSALSCEIFKSPLGLYVSDCTDMMIVSHYDMDLSCH